MFEAYSVSRTCSLHLVDESPGCERGVVERLVTKGENIRDELKMSEIRRQEGLQDGRLQARDAQARQNAHGRRQEDI